ncbi:MAG: ABC transporter permease [Oscillospiraceae bacterium]|nr:ABC transporter permease [Oscillospiraceae bacterium]
MMKRNSRAFFRNPVAVAALVILVAVVLFCIVYPIVSPYSYWKMVVPDRLQPPSAAHPLGTDNFGRDLLTRTAFGGRVTLSVAVTSGLISAVIGTLLGILCGYAGGRTDSILMRLMDMISSIPSLLLAIVFDYSLGIGDGNFLFGIAIAGIPPFAKLVRAAVLEIGGSAYVEASLALGASHLHVVRKHVFHNVLPLAAVQATTSMADALTTCTILGYINVSIRPPMPEWGSLFGGGAAQLRTLPYMALVPAAAIVICIVCLYLLGNGIRDSLSISGGEV